MITVILGNIVNNGNNVLLVKIGGPVLYTIYHHRNLLFKGFLQTHLLINQPVGKGHL